MLWWHSQHNATLSGTKVLLFWKTLPVLRTNFPNRSIFALTAHTINVQFVTQLKKKHKNKATNQHYDRTQQDLILYHPSFIHAVCCCFNFKMYVGSTLLFRDTRSHHFIVRIKKSTGCYFLSQNRKIKYSSNTSEHTHHSYPHLVSMIKNGTKQKSKLPICIIRKCQHLRVWNKACCRKGMTLCEERKQKMITVLVCQKIKEYTEIK